MRSVILVLVVSVLSGCGDVYVDDDHTDVGFEDVSIFRQKGQRQIQGTQASSTYAPEVDSLDKLLSALTNLPDPDLACRGKTIIIVKDITFDSPAIIGPQHSGLTIVGIGRPRLLGAAIFQVDATVADITDIVIDGVGTSGVLLSIESGDIVGMTFANISGEDGDNLGSITTSGGSEFRRGSIVNSQLATVSAQMSEYSINSSVIDTLTIGSGSSSVLVVGNQIDTITGASMQDSVIGSNFIAGGGITVFGASIAITGNSLGASAIDVAGSTTCTIVGNANVAGITATDGSTIVASNS